MERQRDRAALSGQPQNRRAGARDLIPKNYRRPGRSSGAARSPDDAGGAQPAKRAGQLGLARIDPEKLQDSRRSSGAARPRGKPSIRSMKRWTGYMTRQDWARRAGHALTACPARARRGKQQAECSYVPRSHWPRPMMVTTSRRWNTDPRAGRRAGRRARLGGWRGRSGTDLGEDRIKLLRQPRGDALDLAGLAAGAGRRSCPASRRYSRIEQPASMPTGVLGGHARAAGGARLGREWNHSGDERMTPGSICAIDAKITRDVVRRLTEDEFRHYSAGRHPPRCSSSSTARCPTIRSRAGYFWKSAEPPTVEHVDGWTGEAPTPATALQLARTRARVLAERAAVGIPARPPRPTTADPAKVHPYLVALESRTSTRSSGGFPS